jgi:hypothetical protein
MPYCSPVSKFAATLSAGLCATTSPTTVLS